MAKHQIVIRENTGATKDTAPYLGSYVSKETIREADFAADVGRKCGMSAIQAQAILDGAFEAFEDLEREGLVRINTDVGAIAAVITGSFPTADAPFDRERNKLVLALRLDDMVKFALADVVGTIVSDENVTKLRVDNAMDLENERPYNLLHGQGVFRVAGFNMVLDDEGAAAYLQDGKGTTFDLVVDEVVSKQLFKAHTAELLEPGDYKLVVKSRAGQADGPLQTAFRKVKYLKVAAPTPPVPAPEIVSVEGEREGVVNVTSPFTITGNNLEGATVGLVYNGAVEPFCTVAMTYADGKLTGNANFVGDLENNAGCVRVTTAGGTAMHAVWFENH